MTNQEDIPDVRGEEIFFEFDQETDCFRALLPSGARPAIKPMNSRVLARIVQHFRAAEPQIPKVAVKTPGGLAQEFENEDDPEYIHEHNIWAFQYITALAMRCIWEGLIVPDDDEWAVKYKRLGMDVPKDPILRTEVFAEEMYPTLLGQQDLSDQNALVNAVRQISVPTEEVVQAYRRKFRDEVARDIAIRFTATEGGLHVELGRGGTERVDDVRDTSTPEVRYDPD